MPRPYGRFSWEVELGVREGVERVIGGGKGEQGNWGENGVRVVMGAYAIAFLADVGLSGVERVSSW